MSHFPSPPHPRKVKTMDIVGPVNGKNLDTCTDDKRCLPPSFSQFREFSRVGNCNSQNIRLPNFGHSQELPESLM